MPDSAYKTFLASVKKSLYLRAIAINLKLGNFRQTKFLKKESLKAVNLFVVYVGIFSFD